MERTLSEEEADELAKNKLCLVYTLTKSGNCTNLHFDQVSSRDNDPVHVVWNVRPWDVMMKVRYFSMFHFLFLGPQDAPRIKIQVDQVL